MKPRESRRAVMISARLRHGSGWSDARILNISSRGLLIQAPAAPPRGTYIEICRGPHRIVARVVWTEQERFGVCSQDRLPVESIASGVELAKVPVDASGGERRSLPREQRRPAITDRHAKSRQLSRTMEFLCVIAFGAAAAILAFDAIRTTLSRPLAQISGSLPHAS